MLLLLETLGKNSPPPPPPEKLLWTPLAPYLIQFHITTEKCTIVLKDLVKGFHFFVLLLNPQNNWLYWIVLGIVAQPYIISGITDQLIKSLF